MFDEYFFFTLIELMAFLISESVIRNGVCHMALIALGVGKKKMFLFYYSCGR